jgi:hypothetical protein
VSISHTRRTPSFWIAAVPAAPLQVAPGGRPLPRRRYHLEKGVANGHDGVHEAEDPDVRIVEPDLDAENGAHILDAGLELARNQCDLTQTHLSSRIRTRLAPARERSPRARIEREAGERPAETEEVP